MSDSACMLSTSYAAVLKKQRLPRGPDIMEQQEEAFEGLMKTLR